MGYTQVLRFVTVDMPEQDSDDREGLISELDGEHLVLVLVRSGMLVARNPFGQPLYSSLGPANVINAANITDVVGRVPDKLPDGSDRWAIVRGVESLSTMNSQIWRTRAQ